MPVQLIPEDHKAYKEVQTAIMSLNAAISCLSRALELDENISEPLTEGQRVIMAETISGLLMDREDLIHLGNRLAISA